MMGSLLPIQTKLLGFECEKVPPVSPELQYASFPTGTIRNLRVLPSGTLPLSRSWLETIPLQDTLT